MSKFFDLSKKQPVVAAPVPEVASTVSGLVPNQVGAVDGVSGENLHLLPDWWTFWHHQRYTANEWIAINKEMNAEKDENVDEAENKEDTEEKDNEEKAIEEEKKNRFSVMQNQYLEGTNPVSFPKYGAPDEAQTMVIDSVEQFWQCESNLKSVEKLPQGAELFFFKDGIKPMWEDPRNVKGGRWSFFFTISAHGEKRQESLKRVGMIWERIIMKLACGTFIPADNHYQEIIEREVCGAILSIRASKAIISIWNTHIEYEKYVSDLMNLYRAETARLRRALREDQGGEDGEEVDSGLADAEKVRESSSSDVARVVSRMLHRDSGEDEEEVKPALNRDVDPTADAESDVNEDNQAEDVQKVLKSPHFTGLTPFMIRRGICDSMLRNVAEVDNILKTGENPITANVTELKHRTANMRLQYKRHFNHGKASGETYYEVPGESGSNPGAGSNSNGSNGYRNHNYRGSRENNNGNNNTGSREGNDGTFNFHRRHRYTRHGDNGANERESGGSKESALSEESTGGRGQDSDHVFSFRRRKHYQPAVKNSGEDGESGAENDGFVVQGRRAGNFGRWRRKNGSNGNQRNDKGSNSRNNNHTNNSNPSSGAEVFESSNQSNSFASLGKQRKRLEIKEDGKLIGEVNMLSFGSRRRRLLQKQHTAGSKE